MKTLHKRFAATCRVTGANLATILFVFLSACSAGTNFSQETVNRLQPGVTTYDEAVAQMGKPYSVNTASDGRKLAIWSYASVGGGRAVGVLFDSRGVMERVTSRTDSSGTR
jgi:hypothetical protein